MASPPSSSSSGTPPSARCSTPPRRGLNTAACAPRPRATMQLLGVGLISGATSLLLNSSYNYIPAGVGHYHTLPLPDGHRRGHGAVLWAALHKGARTGSAFFPLAGMFCVAGIKASASLAGYALALGSAVTYAAYLMAMGRLHFDGLHSAGRLFWSNLCVAVVMGGLLLFQRQGRACPGLEGRRRHCAELHTHVRRPTGCFCMASATWARPRRRSHPWLNPLPASSSASCFIPKTKITLVNLLGVGAHTLRHAPGHCTAQASACW